MGALALTAAAAPGAVLRVAHGVQVSHKRLVVYAPASKHARRSKRVRPPRIVSDVRVTAVTTTSVTLEGLAATHGRPILVHFQYGRRGYHLITTFGPWRGAGRVTAQLNGLAPGTRYHVRMVATSCAGCPQGTARGRATSFQTAPLTYQNPVFGPMPDPTGIDDRRFTATYWSYGTGGLFPIAKSTDLVHWTSAGSAFQSRPAWVPQQGTWNPWAPSVIGTGRPCPGATSGNCYVMFYAARGAGAGFQCIGVATSSSPGGPFADQGTLQTDPPTPDAANRPFGCGDAAGYGYIDPDPFIDSDGHAYLYLSAGEACDPGGGGCKLAPTISVIPLADDLIHADGPRTPLFAGNPGTWEAQGGSTPTVENPWMLKHDGVYYLLYSGGSWQAAYGMGYMTAPTPTGPFTRGPNNPFLRQTAAVLSPGGGSVTVGPHGGDWLVYHARAASEGYRGVRTLRIDPLVWGPDGTLAVRGPTVGPQTPVP